MLHLFYLSFLETLLNKSSSEYIYIYEDQKKCPEILEKKLKEQKNIEEAQKDEQKKIKNKNGTNQATKKYNKRDLGRGLKP